MGKVVKLGSKTDPETPQRRPAGAQGKGPSQGLAGMQVTPPLIAAAVLLVILLLGGVWFVFGRPDGAGGASATLLDTGTEASAPSSAATHANGMDTSTDSPGPAASNNGMDTSTGR